MESEILAVGDRVNHPQFGLGTVTVVGQGFYGVVFDSGKQANIKAGYLPKASAQDALTDCLGDRTNWPDSTFLAEPEDTPHFLGAHWQPFTDDAQAIFEGLPQYLQEALLQTGYGDIYRSPRPVPDSWGQGVQLVWPLRVHGLALVLIVGKENNRIASVYPFYSSGIQLTLTLREVLVWESGVEAQITARWGESEITFFDSQFLINRAWYQADRAYEFILTGVAYEAGPAEATTFEAELPQAILDYENRFRGPDEPLLEGIQAFNLKGAAIFLPISDWDRDDYSFRGTIKAVEPMKEWLGQQGWKVTVTVMRFGDEDADLSVIVTEQVWQGASSPQVGEDMEGALWLQGYLWMA